MDGLNFTGMWGRNFVFYTYKRKCDFVTPIYELVDNVNWKVTMNSKKIEKKTLLMILNQTYLNI